jgi:hypothetical protein
VLWAVAFAPGMGRGLTCSPEQDCRHTAIGFLRLSVLSVPRHWLLLRREPGQTLRGRRYYFVTGDNHVDVEVVYWQRLRDLPYSCEGGNADPDTHHAP